MPGRNTFAVGVLALALAFAFAACNCVSPEPPPDEAPGPTDWRPGPSPPPWPEEIQSLRFGVAPYADSQVIQDTFRPLNRYLARQLGIPVTLVVTNDYADIIAQVAQQTVDFAQIPPAGYVTVKARDPDVKLLATQIAEGVENYGGYIVVRTEDPAERLEDLAGRTFCYVDPNSASGYLLPRAQLRKLGHDPDRFFGDTQFGGNHSACLRRVVSGAVDAACVSTTAITAARRAAFPLTRIKVIAKTPRIPWDAYVVRSKLPEAAAKRILWELLSLSTRTPSGRDVLAGPIRMNAWRQVDDSDYDVVRDALRLGGR